MGESDPRVARYPRTQSRHGPLRSPEPVAEGGAVNVPVMAVSIDVECDKDERWAVRRPLTFKGVHEGIGERLTPLFAEYGVRPTYLLSPEVIRDGACADLFRELQDCELGTHLHPEFVLPGPLPAETTAVPCQLPEAEERQG